jgi:hypothetical protein
LEEGKAMINKINYLYVLRESPCSKGASWGVCGSGVPPYSFLNLYGIFDCRFCISFPEKRLEVKSFNGWTKAEDLKLPGALHP